MERLVVVDVVVADERGVSGFFSGVAKVHVAHWPAEFAGCEAVNGRDLCGERAEGGGLNVLLVFLLLQVGVVALEIISVVAKLVEARGLDQHPGVGAREAGHRKGSDDGCRYEDVGVVQGNRHFPHGSCFVPADKDDVIPLLQMKPLRDQNASTRVLDWPLPPKGRARRHGGIQPKQMKFSNRHLRLLNHFVRSLLDLPL